MNKNVDKKNKILAAVLLAVALTSTIGAIIWFGIYAPIIIKY